MSVGEMRMADVEKVERGDRLRDEHVRGSLVADEAGSGCACLTVDVDVDGFAFCRGHVGWC